PIVRWNTNSLFWGAAGLTALSPCWEDDGGGGQAPITALTRRHGYTRGHSMGADGFTKARNGKRVCFLTTRNDLIMVKIKLPVVRTAPTSHQDYTLLLFDRDLPDSIESIATIRGTNLFVKMPYVPDAPWPVARTEQSGQIGLFLPGFSANVMKAGDSGSP